MICLVQAICINALPAGTRSNCAQAHMLAISGASVQALGCRLIFYTMPVGLWENAWGKIIRMRQSCEVGQVMGARQPVMD